MRDVRDIVKIELSGGQLKPLLPLDRAGEQSIRLTTIAGFQRAGKVRVFLGGDRGEDRLLRELIFRGIPPAAAGDPDIDLHARFDGKKDLRLRIIVDGRQYLSEDVRIGRPVRVLPWLSAAAVLVLLLGLGYLLATSFTAGSVTSGPVSGTSGPAADSAGTPAPAGASGGTAAVRPAAPGTASPGSSVGGSVRSEAAAPAPPAPPGGAARTVLPLPPRPSAPAAGSESPAGDSANNAASGPASGAASGAAAGVPVPPPDRSAAVSERREAVVFFDADVDRVNRWAAGRLDGLIAELRRTDGEILAIEGHTALFGSEVGREQLSLARARNVLVYLREQGWRQPEEPEIEGYGSRLPVTDREEEQQQNRRVVVRYSAGG